LAEWLGVDLLLNIVRKGDGCMVTNAANHGHAAVFHLLKKWGYTLQDAQRDSSALHWAARRGHVHVMQVFRDWGFTKRDVYNTFSDGWPDNEAARAFLLEWLTPLYPPWETDGFGLFS